MYVLLIEELFRGEAKIPEADPVFDFGLLPMKCERNLNNLMTRKKLAWCASAVPRFSVGGSINKI
ncbi:hypothetical protein BOTNAR_0050g00250 [Botryotinia narcissicola]|uniref:Uncharacterized protein n=1 Tax=Botryotinia narcissicola TaxID=278944 RepID=A0A4Z1J072_9HELO|nr:hypothetical protein BOTNAR_0050g00250 [Botryotinia narcissicola]